MELNFEYNGEIGVGNYPDLLQFPKTETQQFYVKSGEIWGKASTKIDNGEFDTVTWLEENNVSPPNDLDINLLELKTLAGFGIVGSYLNSNDKQVMIIHEFQQDMSDYFSSATIKHSIDSPIASFNLTLENPIDTETEIEGPIAINEQTSILTPGAKVIFSFTAGDDLEEIELGSFYIDRSDYKSTSETAKADGRNLIGKALKTQTLNENNYTGYKEISTIINELLDNANLGIDQYEVENNLEKRRFEFTPNTQVLSALEEILQSLVTWKMEETASGEIIIGSPNFGLFPQRSRYTFYKDVDAFSRQIKRDDIESYRKVCIHDSEWNIQEYVDVDVYSGWNLQSNKTLFVQVADGTSLASAQAIGLEVANRLQNVGKIESFVGPFRPQLLIGDEAQIVDEHGTTSLGTITEINHNLEEVYTSFTVDSGGQLGRGSFANYINMINKAGESGSIGYEDIIPEPPILADLTEYNAVLANVNQVDYTPESWTIYQGVVLANVMTVNNTQEQVDIATIKIEIAQGKLVLL